MLLDQVQKDSIIQNEVGILQKQGSGFHLSSDFAKKNLVCIPWADDYQCTKDYQVNRSYLDSFLLMYIRSGKMKINYEQKEHTASAGDVIFLNLRKPHQYRALSDLNVLQFMVNGGPTAAYFEYLYHMHGPVFKGSSRVSFLFSSLQSELASDLSNDHRISLLVIEIYCILSKNPHIEVSSPVKLAMDYMDTHYKEAITINQVADQVALSKYYFIRLFHRETSFSPKEYLNRIRLRNAMRLLSESANTVEEIALRCGFSSSTVFIRAFKKETCGITPERFRQYFSGIPMEM